MHAAKKLASSIIAKKVNVRKVANLVTELYARVASGADLVSARLVA
jgi:hypothetical protein